MGWRSRQSREPDGFTNIIPDLDSDTASPSLMRRFTRSRDCLLTLLPNYIYDLTSIYSNSSALAQWQSSKSSMFSKLAMPGAMRQLKTLANKRDLFLATLPVRSC